MNLLIKRFLSEDSLDRIVIFSHEVNFKISFLMAKICRSSSLLSSVYFLILNRGFIRECRAVMSAKYKYLKSDTHKSYLLREKYPPIGERHDYAY